MSIKPMDGRLILDNEDNEDNEDNGDREGLFFLLGLVVLLFA